MNILDQFSRKAPGTIVTAILLGIVAGLAYAALIPTLLAAVQEDRAPLDVFVTDPYLVLGVEISHHRLAAWFACLCLLIWCTRTVSQILLVRIATAVAQDLRNSIFESISRTTIARLERVGLERIQTALATDVARIVNGGKAIPDIVINTITVVGILGFILYLNSSVFWFSLGGIAVGTLTFQLPVIWSNRYFARARQVADLQAEAVRGLVEGAKELKINETKRQRFVAEVLQHNERASASLETTGASILRAAVAYGDLVNIVSVGMIGFVLVNYRAVGQAELTGVVMALLYLTGPVAAILGGVPQLALGSLSQGRIRMLLTELPAEQHADHAGSFDGWTTLRFQDVRYQHLADPDVPAFEVGPLNFTLRRAQTTFLVGGNGSGKSTIAKLITMHYLSSQGSILVDGRPVVQALVQAYRDQVCAIFSDYYLFDRLLDVPPSQQRKIDSYLARLGLAGKVELSKGRFSTLKLSDGQRRRLALLVGYVEDRALYLFDEWAADQDPEFKAFFYEVLLPEMRAAGKTVVAITHDDRYFHLADQVLFVEHGVISQRSIVAAA